VRAGRCSATTAPSAIRAWPPRLRIKACYDALTRTGLAEYVTNVATAAATQRAEIEGLRPLALDPSVRQLAAETRPPGDSDRDPRPPSPTTDQARAWRELGIDPRLPDLRSAHGALMGLATRRSPHEPLIRFDDKPSPARNPILIALAAEATARLLQLDAGLNYLGYADDYVPPWRFAYLVDRARYFTSHARQVQAMYLAFLQSAEREHLQEQSAAHNAALEQASVAVETQRLEQSRAELATSQAGTQLATLVAVNAAARATDYVALDQRLDEIARKQKKRRRWGNALRVVGSALVSAGEGFAKSGGNPYAAAASAGMSVFNDIPDILEASNANLQLDAQDEQREFEKRNYARAAAEATGSVVVAARREQAAAAAVEVASLTRLVALMRHEAALQMLAFLRNRTLNAELWYRLADAVRSVAATYLERAVELAFLAERALEYETGRRHDVVRFDYDASELGDFLAADLLARDVDALEHALIVGETARRQVVRYVVSLARDYPDTLERLRNRGAATLHVTLAQLEARFSGMVNLRIAAVDIQPIALLDPTRFAIQLTHLGTSQARMRNAADSPALGAEPVPSWTADTETDGTPPALTIDGRWPVMGFAAAPATEVFTGISPLLQAQLDPDVAARQRKAFESRGAASSWRIDLSARENRLEPITLADVLVAFELTGTHDPVLEPELRARIPTDSVQTTHLVASSTFPSAHFDFARRGTMTWEVDQGWIPTGLRTGLLRNVGFVLHSRSMPGHLGRITATTEVRVHVAADGTVTLGTPIPRVTLSIERLQVTARVELDGPVDSLRWQFDTDTDWLDAEAGTDVVHTFVRPGRYDARLRLVRAGRLVELTVALAVSADEDLAPPLLVVPTVDVVDTGDVDETCVAIGVTNGPEEPDAFTARWIGTDDDGPIARTEPAEIVLARGRTHTIEVEAVRTLRARVSCTQRYSDTANLTVTDLIATTNRASDEPPTELTQLLFGPGDDLSPLDTWVLELPADVNPALRVADATGRIDVDTSDIEDLRLVLEYATTSRD
jgi:hypothetical protein